MTTVYTKDDQYTMDIDWFLTGQDNVVAHFSSGGAILPEIIAQNAQDNITLIDFFETLPINTEVVINPFIGKYVNLKNISSLENYVESYKSFAQRGILSFDKIEPCAGNHDIGYFLVATPVQFLDFSNLPDKITKILLSKKQEINFKNFNKIDAGYIPWTSLFENYYIPIHYRPTKKKSFWDWF